MNDVRKHYAAISICCAVLCLCVVAAPRAQQTNQAAAQGGDFKISVGVNSVLVPVVVRDSHGRGVGDLTQKDFELFDQDKPRPIAGFSVQKRAAGAESAAAASATSPAPTRASDAATNALTATAPVPRLRRQLRSGSLFFSSMICILIRAICCASRMSRRKCWGSRWAIPIWLRL